MISTAERLSFPLVCSTTWVGSFDDADVGSVIAFDLLDYINI